MKHWSKNGVMSEAHGAVAGSDIAKYPVTAIAGRWPHTPPQNRCKIHGGEKNNASRRPNVPTEHYRSPLHCKSTDDFLQPWPTHWTTSRSARAAPPATAGVRQSPPRLPSMVSLTRLSRRAISLVAWPTGLAAKTANAAVACSTTATTGVSFRISAWAETIENRIEPVCLEGRVR